MSRPKKPSRGTADDLISAFLYSHKNGMTQQEIADALGVDRSLYAKWLSQGKMVTPENLVKICRYYGVSADYILGLSDKMSINEHSTKDDIIKAFHMALKQLESDSNVIVHVPVGCKVKLHRSTKEGAE